MATAEQLVKVEYKTGQYIAKVVQEEGRRTLVEVAAVLRHPIQGDLHTSFNPDVALFHERKASAEREKIWIMGADIAPYAGEVPDYRSSLTAAWQAEVARIDALKRWAERCLQQLEAVGSDYGLTNSD